MGLQIRFTLFIGVLISVLNIQAHASCGKKEFPQFQCVSDGKCIDQELTCNGFNDCADGSDENLSNCTNGCLFNTTVIKQGETGQDQEWWYTCTRSRWIISGCVINGQRFKVGETFQLLTRQGIFWGKCEKIDQYHYMRQPYGCVDASGRNIDNGQVFQMNQLFWGTCSVNKTTTQAPEIGTVPVNDVKWKITGCNDGSQKVVADNQEFIWIIDPFRLLGVQIRCHLPKKENEWPDIKPTGCVINAQSNSTPANSPPTFKVLRNKCFSPIDKLIYYCTIAPKTATVPPSLLGKISTWDDDWLLNITDNQEEEIQGLKSKGFSMCSQTPKAQPVIPKIPLPPPLPGQGAPGQGFPQGQGLPPNQGLPQGNGISPNQGFPSGQVSRKQPSPNGNRQHVKRSVRMNGDLWTNVVDMRGSRNIRSLLSPRRESLKLAKTIMIQK